MIDKEKVLIGWLAFIIGVLGAVAFKSVHRLNALEEADYVLVQQIYDNEQDIKMLKERIKLVEYKSEIAAIKDKCK